ncbi:MAG: universal stress protein [Chloroflexota bacterium]|nr:universal stress protein [Chloroflexota bacterium]
MNEREHGQEIERILVALDASPHSLSALQAASELATRLRAKLEALFIEDVDVRRLGALPFAEEVGIFSARCHPLDAVELTRQLEAQARRMRRRFRRITEWSSVQCTFRRARGRVVPEILEAALEADMVILGKEAWATFETGRLGAAVRQVLSQIPIPTLILQAGARVELPVLAIYDGSQAAHRALSVAATLAKRDDFRLMVLILADESEAAGRLQARAGTWLEGRGLDVRYQILTEASASRLAVLVARQGYGTVVLPRQSSTIQDEAVLDFLDETEVPVLLVR